MKFFAPFVIVLLLALFGCSSVPVVDHSFDPNYNLLEYRTFAVLPIPHSLLEVEAMEILGEDDISLVGLKAVLDAKGFQYIEKGHPDFVVGMRAEIGMSEPKPLVRVYDSGIIYNTWFDSVDYVAPVPRVESIIDASEPNGMTGRNSMRVSMFVEVFDATSKKIVWKGWATSTDATAFHSDGARLRIVNQIMQRFPN